jgi:hypothetical protein
MLERLELETVGIKLRGKGSVLCEKGEKINGETLTFTQKWF